jgi:mRNA-degrading endonuclease RelE of RelBE toxin-antitoxin system
LRAYDRAAILELADRLLANDPLTESRARIKRLRQPAPAQFRLRVGDFRVFYDVSESVVKVIRILPKQNAVRFAEGLL